MVAGVAWGMTMVNLKQPVVLEGFLKKHGIGFGDSDAFANGVMSALMMRKDTTPDEGYIAALLAYEPASKEPSVEALWNRVFKQSATKGLEEYYPAIKQKGRLGEIFRFQTLADLAR